VDQYARTFTVRWADCDANGHLRSTGYSDYAIEVRMAYLSDHGFGLAELKQAGIGPVILREEIDYLRECHMGEELQVTFTIQGLSPDGARFKMVQDLWKPNGKQAAHLVVLGGWLDTRARRLTAPPDALREAFEKAPRGGPFETLPSLDPR
jgi:acyl-CoA thioester hydrolase